MISREAQTVLRERFKLRDGQFFADQRFKNLWWYLNGEEFGYGDLRNEDLLRIKVELSNDEVFVGFNEHHGSRWQQTHDTRVLITHDTILRAGDGAILHELI